MCARVVCASFRPVLFNQVIQKKIQKVNCLIFSDIFTFCIASFSRSFAFETTERSNFDFLLCDLAL